MSVYELYPADAWPARAVWPAATSSTPEIPGFFVVYADAACPFLASFFEATLWGPEGEPGMFVIGRRLSCGSRDILWHRCGVTPWNANPVSASLATALQCRPKEQHSLSANYAAEAKQRSERFSRWLRDALLDDGSGGKPIREALIMEELRATR